MLRFMVNNGFHELKQIHHKTTYFGNLVYVSAHKKNSKRGVNLKALDSLPKQCVGLHLTPL